METPLVAMPSICRINKYGEDMKAGISAVIIRNIFLMRYRPDADKLCVFQKVIYYKIGDENESIYEDYKNGV